MATARDVAAWMLSEFNLHGELHQDYAAEYIAATFGEEFVYLNQNENLAISQEVLDEFRDRTRHSAVWVKPERYWRRRELGDAPRRQQDQ